jgi:F-type H+-transporting ATPase subunit epsilon
MLKVEIITPERIVHQTEGEGVIVPTIEGQIGVRSGHLPLIAILQTGEIIVKKPHGRNEFYAVAGGFVEVLPNMIRVMADSADRADELDEMAVHQAIERARKAKEEAEDDVKMADATALLELNIARQKAIQRKKAHGGSGKGTFNLE